MSLTSEQARAMNGRPRISPDQKDRMISMWADGCSVAEVHEEFPEWSVQGLANRKSDLKDQIEDLRRARSVQLSEIPGARQAARVNDYWELRTIFRMLAHKHLESCYATNLESGEREFVEQLVDARKMKVYNDAIGKNNRAIAEETGQLRVVPEVGPVGMPVMPMLLERNGEFFQVQEPCD